MHYAPEMSRGAARGASRICLVSGGTGGHLMPALALGRALLASGREPLLITEGRDVERELVRRELPEIAAVEVPRSGRSAGSLPWWLLRATARARGLLKRHEVGAVVSTGGRASVPVALAARSLGVPVFLLEQNAVTGRANRWLRSIAERMYTGLPFAGERSTDDRRRGRVLHTGTPLREGFGRADVADARRALGLDDRSPVVLVTGGSQGARALNETAPPALLRLGRSLQVVHLAGLGNEAAVEARYAPGGRDLAVTVRAVAADMDRLFAAADLVICRGGGTTVAELMAVGRAAVVVPYPHHKDQQQLHNARVLERVGAAVICEEDDLTVDALADRVGRLLEEPARLRAMSDEARKLRRPDAAEAILRDVESVVAVGRDAGGDADGDARDRAEAPARAQRRRGGAA